MPRNQANINAANDFVTVPGPGDTQQNRGVPVGYRNAGSSYDDFEAAAAGALRGSKDDRFTYPRTGSARNVRA